MGSTAELDDEILINGTYERRKVVYVRQCMCAAARRLVEHLKIASMLSCTRGIDPTFANPSNRLQYEMLLEPSIYPLLPAYVHQYFEKIMTYTFEEKEAMLKGGALQ